MMCETCGTYEARFECRNGWTADKNCPFCTSRFKLTMKDAGRTFTLVDLETMQAPTFGAAKERLEHAVRWYEALRGQGISADRARPQSFAITTALWECMTLATGDPSFLSACDVLAESAFLMADTADDRMRDTPLTLVNAETAVQ